MKKRPAARKKGGKVPASPAKAGGARQIASKALESALQREISRQGGTKNPILKRAADKGPAELLAALERVKAVMQARDRQLSAAEKKARVGRKDRGKMVVFDTEGRRYKTLLTVPKGRKVYAFKVDSIGRRRWLNPVDPSSVGPGSRQGARQPLGLKAFDWKNFQRLAPREYGDTIQKLGDRVSRWPFKDTVFRVKPGKEGLDEVAKSVAQTFQQAAKSEQEHTQWVAEMIVKVKGVREPLRLTTQIMRSGQFFDLELGTRKMVPRFRKSAKVLKEVIGYQTRDLVRRELANRGLVSQGSARRVGRLSANRGRSRAEWVTNEGRPWHGRDKDVARVELAQYRLKRVF